PFILAAGVWEEVQNFTIDAKTCTLSFQVPKNSIFSIMQYLPPAVVSTANATATAPPSNALPSNVPVVPANVVTTHPPQKGLPIAEYIIAVAALSIAFYFIIRKLRAGQRTLKK
ncbi:MAG: hypothetical protein M1448_02755, partial [Candidatus Marsarchaeota archaeon]|nr:hypothetical protein [Candidatus Marsarchaeota archaeon]